MNMDSMCSDGTAEKKKKKTREKIVFCAWDTDDMNGLASYQVYDWRMTK